MTNEFTIYEFRLKFVFIFSITFLFSSNLFSQNINISHEFVFDGEPYMEIDPGNSQHIIVGWMGYSVTGLLGIKTIVSFNGGQTWSSPLLLPHFSQGFHSADPSIGFDHAGNLFACYVDYRENPDSGGIYICKSVNGGMSWHYLSKAMDAWSDNDKKPIDRPWLTINPVNNHLYITSKPAPWITAPNRPYFIVSIDDGVTWNPWRYIDDTGFLVGNFIQAPMAAASVSKNGAFHCMYPSWVFSQNPLPGYIHAKSVDDGGTFSYHGACFSNAGVTDTLAKAGGRLACDPADSNHLAFTFIASKNGDPDVFLIESLDDGITWTTPYRVNSDPVGNGKMQDLVWSGFDNKGGLAIAWRDRRNAPGTGYSEASEIWGAFRWKDSTNFSVNFRISDTLAAYQNVLALAGNDFMNIGVVHDTLVSVWGDTRSGILSIWFSRFSLKSLVSNRVQNIILEPVPQVSIYPDPGNAVFYFKGDNVFEVDVADVTGKAILHQKNQHIRQIDLSGEAPGSYILYLKTEKGILNKRLIKK